MTRAEPDDKAKTADSGPDTPTGDEKSTAESRPKEIGGRDGLDPTRYGDWEKAGRCIDF